MKDFECSNCNTKTEYSSESEDVNTTSTIVCPSCQTLYDIDNNNNPTKSKFDKTNYRKKIAGIENQLDLYGNRGLGSKSYTVPCPHCKHIWELKGVPIKSLHWCSKCYQYFGIDGVKITIISNEEKEKGRVDYKHGFDVHAILPPSIFWHDIDKLADWWSNYKEEDKELELEEAVNMG